MKGFHEKGRNKAWDSIIGRRYEGYDNKKERESPISSFP